MGTKEEKQARLNITGLVDLLIVALMGGWMDGSMCGWTDRGVGVQAGRQMVRRTEKQTS